MTFREFLKNIRSPMWQATNPSCEIKHEILRPSSKTPSQIRVEYVNGFKHKFKASAKPKDIEYRMRWMSAYLEGGGVAPGHVMEEVELD